MGKTEDFLRKHMLTAASVDTDKTLDFVLSEMKKGLEDEESSSLRMIATYVQPDVEIVPGASVIVLDAGGTNFRTCLVTFDENRQPVISDFRTVGLRTPGSFQCNIEFGEPFGVLSADRPHTSQRTGANCNRAYDRKAFWRHDRLDPGVAG